MKLVKSAWKIGDLLRDVELQGTGYRLTVWELPHTPRMSTGQERLAYAFRNRSGEVLFSGDDYGCSPCVAVDSDAMLRGLLGFLTLRPGDTDADYFDNYTEAQRAFAEGDAEELSLWTLRETDGDSVPLAPLPFVDWPAGEQGDDAESSAYERAERGHADRHE